jgi:hypothetical protein
MVSIAKLVMFQWCPLLWAQSYPMGLGQLVGFYLLGAHKYLGYSESVVVLCCKLTSHNYLMSLCRPLLVFSAVRSRVHDDPWPTVQLLHVDVLRSTLANTLVGRPLCLPLLYVHKYLKSLASLSASAGVLCCTLTSTWWALASWSASVGVLCCTLTIVASCFSRSCSTGPLKFGEKRLEFIPETVKTQRMHYICLGILPFI